MKSLRARLFAATLAALALTLALTIAIGAVLTRRQVDRSQVTSLGAPRRRSRAATARERQLHQPEHALGQRPDPRRSRARSSRQYVPDVEQVERREDDLRGRALSLLVPARSRRAGCCCCGRRACARPSGSRSCATCCSRRSPALRSRRRCRSWSPARSSRPIRRVADATRALAADEQHEPLPEEGTTEVASLARAFNEMAQQLAASREAERELPALGQPRAEDAADGDPRLRRGAGRRRVRRRRGRAHDRARGRPARAARPRPARPGADEPQRVLGSQRARRPRRGRPRGRRAGTRRAAKQFGVALRGRRRGDLGRGRRRPAAAGRVEPRRERAARDAAPAVGSTVTRRARAAERRRHGPGHRRRRPAARVRALLPLRQGRQGPARRQRARPGDRAAARDARWAGTSRVESGPARNDVRRSALRPQLRGVDDLEVGAVQRA